MRRKIGVFAAVALIACLLAVSPVVALPAPPESESFTYDASLQWDTVVSSATTSEYRPSGFAITFNDLSAWSSISNFVVINGQYWSSSGSSSGSAPCTYSVGSTKLGTGTVNFNKNYNPDGSYKNLIVWFTFNGDWDVGKLAGRQSVSCSYDPAQISGLSFGSANWARGYVAPSKSQDVYVTSGGIAYRQDTIANAAIHWRNEITVSPIDSLSSTVEIKRHLSKSFISIYVGQIGYYSATDTADKSVVVVGSPISVTVNGPAGKTWTHQFLAPPPTPTPTASSAFALSLSPETTGSVGSPITATLTPAADAPRYSEISWTWTDPDGNVDVEIYQKSSSDWTTWTHYNKSAFQFEPTAADPHILTFTPTGAGTWTVSAVVRDQQPPSSGAALAEVSAACEVERKAGDVDVIVSVFDGAASSPSYLSGVGVTVWDLSRNSTVIYDSTGEYIVGASGTTNGVATFTAPLGDQVRITVSRTSYVTHTETAFVQPTALPLNQMPISITLMPAATPAADQVYMSFTVVTLTNQPIAGAAVTAGNNTAVTNSLGNCRISIPANSTIPYSISKSGYYSSSGYIMPMSENSAITIQLMLISAVVTTSPTGGVTASPTADPRTPEEKAESAFSIIFDHLEVFATLAGLILLVTMIDWLVPGGRRR